MALDPHLVERIESIELLVDATTASSLDGLLRVLTRDLAFRRLSAAVPREVGPDEVVRRIAELASDPTDERYANPNDVAIAAYLLAIAGRAPTYFDLAQAVAEQAERVWWTPRVIRRIQSMDYNPLASTSIGTFATGSRADVTSLRRSGSGDVVGLFGFSSLGHTRVAARLTVAGGQAANTQISRLHAFAAAEA